MMTRLTASIALFALCAALGVLLLLPLVSVVNGAIGAPNISVRTQVNITNAAPFVANVSMTFPVTLNANTTSKIFCNFSVLDLNNITDLIGANVTFYHTVYSRNHLDDSNVTHYRNASCTNFTDQSSFTREYSCSLDVNYNAQAGNWTCNATIIDSFGATGYKFATTTVNDLIAIGVLDIIDFGQLNVSQASSNVPFNVTNYGNVPVNITVFGYGAVENDSAAMICDQGNISIDNLYVTGNASNWESPVGLGLMIPLNSSNATRKLVTNLTILPYNLTYEASLNTTIWRLFASSNNNPFGLCNGTVIFTGIKATT